MKLTNKQKAYIRKIAPHYADRLADKIWDILDYYEMCNSVLHDDSRTKGIAEKLDLEGHAENYLLIQIGKNLGHIINL